MNTSQIMKAFSEADIVAAKSRQIAGWMLESLEKQEALGNLDREGQANLKMGRELIENLDEYLAKPIMGEV